MSRLCTICRHMRRAAIEDALMHGQSIRSVAREFGVGKDSLVRHQAHIQANAVIALATCEVAAEAPGATLARIRTAASSMYDLLDRLYAMLDLIDPEAIALKVLVIKEIRSVVASMARIGLAQADIVAKAEARHLSPELQAMIDKVLE